MSAQEPQQEAQSPLTPPERLRELARDASQEISAALAQNPNTPRDILLSLAPTYPEKFLQNPVIPLFLLEDPTFVVTLSAEVCVALLRAARPEGLSGAKPPEWLLVGAAHHRHKNVLYALCEHPQTPLSSLEVLYHRGFGYYLAKHPNLSSALLEQLIIDFNLGTRQVAQHHPRAPRELLRFLYRLGSAPDLCSLAPPDLSITVEELEHAFQRGSYAWVLVAAHPNAPPSMLEELARRAKRGVENGNRDGWTILQSLAKNTASPGELLAELETFCRRQKRDPARTDTRCEIAQNPSTPVSVLEGYIALFTSLSKLSFPRILYGLAKNPKLPLHLLERFASSRCITLQSLMIQHPNISKKILRRLMKDPYERIRKEAQQRLQALEASTPKNPGV